MTDWTEAADLLDEREIAPRGSLTRSLPGVMAFVLSASIGVYVVYLRPALSPSPAPAEVAVQPEKPAPFGGLAPALSFAQKATSSPFGALVLKGFGSKSQFTIAEAETPLPPVRLRASDPGASDDAPLPPTPPETLRLSDDDSAPLPPRRPSELARAAEPPRSAPPRLARLEPRPTAPAATPAPAASPNLFARLFGGSGASPAKEPEARLAYAAPAPTGSNVSAALSVRSGLNSAPSSPGGFLRGLTFGSNPTARFGDHVAVYDISARVVYLPDGTRLEAHSGLGESRDDPNRVNVRMRGPTPPATYALTPRETLFHGVAALRLTPTDSSIYGRAGLLAHTYMLGAEGDSNGCVSFRDYDAFLRAYRSGQINKLVVVTRL